MMVWKKYLNLFKLGLLTIKLQTIDSADMLSVHWAFCELWMDDLRFNVNFQQFFNHIRTMFG